jgi:hypothetical protein
LKQKAAGPQTAGALALRSAPEAEAQDWQEF